MEEFTKTKVCKYCTHDLQLCYDEGLECAECKNFVHVRCLKRGSVPGGLNGDLFYKFTCQECCYTGSEMFVRIKISWLQAVNLVLYHLLTKSPGLSRNGFYHWRNHIVTFIDNHWELLFTSEVRKKKKWVGTVAGRLSYYSNYVFLSGAKTSLNKTAWWTLLYPKLSPAVTSSLYSIMTAQKQSAKAKNEKKFISDAELFHNIILKYITNTELRQVFSVDKIVTEDNLREELPAAEGSKKSKSVASNKRKNVLPPNFTQISSKKLMKYVVFSEEPKIEYSSSTTNDRENVSQKMPSALSQKKEIVKLLDPFCHFNTSISNISRLKGQKLHTKLMGGIRKEVILSPYSGIYLKPYIWRDTETVPPYLKLMAELQMVANKNNPEYELPPRSCLDYVYVQPELIPAINSLCNQFFWPGIDLTESLQYPDFSCVVLYKKLIVGFAFMVPDVKHTENYVSFLFTRPGWRNCGIARFMLYHLIQTSLGKDITLHVSVNNPAIFLYQKFGFKVEQFVKDFYDKYYRSDVSESKHAFFCRLERDVIN